MSHRILKKINALIPSVREEECDDHHFSWTGKMPMTGRCLCMMCNTEQRGWVYQQIRWDATGPGWTSICKTRDFNVFAKSCLTCLSPILIPDPRIDGPVTEPFPSHGCLGAYCG